jgi:hypothetical protein
MASSVVVGVESWSQGGGAFVVGGEPLSVGKLLLEGAGYPEPVDLGVRAGRG